MPNGKTGDHPYTDIVVHGRDVYSEHADSLIREIATLADDPTQRKLADRLLAEFGEYNDPDVEKLERVLTNLRDTLRREAGERGFDS